MATTRRNPGGPAPVSRVSGRRLSGRPVFSGRRGGNPIVRQGGLSDETLDHCFHCCDRCGGRPVPLPAESAPGGASSEDGPRHPWNGRPGGPRRRQHRAGAGDLGEVEDPGDRREGLRRRRRRRARRRATHRHPSRSDASRAGRGAAAVRNRPRHRRGGHEGARKGQGPLGQGPSLDADWRRSSRTTTPPT